MSIKSANPTISAATYDPAAPALVAGFDPFILILQYVSGGDAYVSVDGVADLLRIGADQPLLVLPLRYSKVWARKAGDDSAVLLLAASNDTMH